MIRSLQRLAGGLLVAFAVVALALGYWIVVRGPALLAREDNPRSVLAEQRIRRGSILDRNGEVLAESTVDPATGTVSRHYPEPAAVPVVGYYSVRYGVSGIEAAMDGFLRGEGLLNSGEEFWRDLLDQPPQGGDVRLTLDADVQRDAVALMGDQVGSLVVVTAPQGEVLAMTSSPAFNPETLDADWESLLADPDAPLLNRATQGRYQPGEILQSVLLGVGLNTGVVSPDDEWQGRRVVSVGDVTLPCAGDAGNAITLATAYIEACPAPFQRVAGLLGAERLLAGLEDFALIVPQPFVLPVEPADPGVTVESLEMLAVGQGDLTVSPLQMALVAAALSDNGRLPAPVLVEGQRAPGGQWQETVPGNARGTISRAAVDAVKELMIEAAETGAAQAASRGQARIYGHAGLAISGEDTYNAWFIGFVYRGDEQAIATAVLLENSDDVDGAARIGGAVLRSALASYR